MKISTTIIGISRTIIGLCCLVAGLSLLCAASASAESSVGVVEHLEGQAVAQLQDKKRALDSGSPLFQGDVLETMADSSLLARFTDGGALRMGENSRVVVEQYVYDENGRNSNALFSLFKGFVRLVTGALVKMQPDRFRVTTPLASVGVRGTDFFARIVDDGENIGVYQLDEGHAVAVATEKDAVLIDKEGYYTHVGLDGTLSPLSRISKEMHKNFGRSMRRMQNMRLQRF